MSFFQDFLKNLFGGIGSRNHKNQRLDDYQEHKERFRNPIWQNDEEEDGEYENNYRPFGNHRNGFHFEVFTNPFEMTRYFESQMENMMKDFFSFGFGQHSGMFREHQLPGTLPLAKQNEKSLRDEYLKPFHTIPSLDTGKNPKADIDLDGKVSAEDFSRIWKDPKTSESVELSDPQRQFNFKSFGKSIVVQTVRSADGAIEERRTVTDGLGNSTTTIKKKIDDKIHTIIMKKGEDGVETKTENFKNIDESEISNFANNWTLVEPPNMATGILSQFPWQKFFGFNPKL